MDGRRVPLVTLLALSLVLLTTLAGPGTAVSASHPPDVRHADSPTCSSTTPIASGNVPVPGSITPSAPAPCFTFDNAGGDTVFVNAVSTTSGMPAPTVAVIDPNGNQLLTGVPDNYYADASGTYTIAISDTASTAFNVDLEQMNDPVGCSSVTFGDPPVTADIGIGGQPLCFQFSLPYPEWCLVRFGSVPIQSDAFSTCQTAPGWGEPR